MRKPNVFILLLGFIIYGWIEFETLLFVGNIIGGFLVPQRMLQMYKKKKKDKK